MDWKEFTQRYEGIKARLYRTALLYLGDASAAEEALDETVCKALHSCRGLRQPEYFNTWITRILLNVCADERKRKKKLMNLSDIPEIAAESYDSLPLRDAVARLPKELSSVVILRYFSGYTLKEAADILDIPQGTAATRQRRALALLRLDLGEEEEA